MILGGVGVLAVVVLLIASDREDKTRDTGAEPARRPPAAKPHVPATRVAVGSGSAGRAPGRPAPPLTRDMLNRAATMLQEAKLLNNEATKLRNRGDNEGARAKNSAAKAKIDEVKAFLDGPATWQEEADMGEWTQTAEYVALGRFYGEISKLEKRVRMGGGTR